MSYKIATIISTYNSRNLALVKLLQKKDINVYVYDDLLSEDEIKMMNLKFSYPNDADIVFDAFNLEIVK